NYVKIYKPFFVGREAFIAREAKRKAEVVRFGVSEKGLPMPQPKDPVVDERGKVIGRVTSCALDTEGTLVGQAYVKEKYQTQGTPLWVLVTPRREPKSRAELEMGDRTQLPVQVEVLRRFPRL
ncbi:MAG: hypothetical protein GVY30_04650, partial [Chloroflexi bacterium]|nr:hypothetical protein [Chloroflexota bacterium]